MRRLLHLSYLLQGNKETSGYTQAEINAAKIMFEYVKKYSGNFTCAYSYLPAIWQAAHFKIAGYGE